MSTEPPILQLEELRAGYGRALILHGINLRVNRGEIALVLGPNGSGKTTLIWTIMGRLPAASGRILHSGKDITRTSPVARARGGIAVVPQGGGLFPGLSVKEHLVIGGLREKNHHRDDTLASIFDLFPDLEERYTADARHLSGGQRQMLAVGRALMARPELLLLDEPSVGLAPAAVANLFRALQRINEERHISMLLVEQNLAAVANVVSSAYLMSSGEIKAEVRDTEELRRTDVWQFLTTRA